VTGFLWAAGLYALVGCGVFFAGAICLVLLALIGSALECWWYGIGRRSGGRKGAR